jgi:hypothetical protein
MEEVKEKILDLIRKKINQSGAEWVGNNFNRIIDSDEIDTIISESIDSSENARIRRAKLDIFRGKIFEEILQELINSHFSNCRGYNHIKCAKTLKEIENNEIKKLVKKIVIKRLNTNAKKSIDRDLIVYSRNLNDRVFLISVKGTDRERIGQFLSHLFIFDDRVLKVKYGRRYRRPNFKYAFVCFDLAKNKDFSDEDEGRIEKKRKGTKQMEVYLINDDYYISGGIYVLNNLPKLNGVGSFSSLLAKIKEFFDL